MWLHMEAGRLSTRSAPRLPWELTLSGRPISAQSTNKQAKAAWKEKVRTAALADWAARGWRPVTTFVRFTIVVCDHGQVGDVDNSIKVTLDGLWVRPSDPLAGRLPLHDDDLVQQVVATRLDTNEPQPSVKSPLLLRALLTAATTDQPAVYIRVDDVVTTEGLLA